MASLIQTDMSHLPPRSQFNRTALDISDSSESIFKPIYSNMAVQSVTRVLKSVFEKSASNYVYLLPLHVRLVVMVYFGAEGFSFGEYSPGPGVSFIP